MRCQLCDFGQDSPSYYAQGLVDDKTNRRVRYNPETGEAICDHCIAESHVEWEEEPDEPITILP